MLPCEWCLTTGDMIGIAHDGINNLFGYGAASRGP
jgi:hypothetical protein